METLIQPEEWDVIVVGSGLPECLIASALAKAGKSVLMIDQEDTYGSDYASFTLEALRQAALGAHPSLTAQSDACTPDTTSAQPTAAMHAEWARQGIRHVPLPAFQLPLHGVHGYCTPDAHALGSLRSCILDLMPKMLYQAEPLVELLVKARAHHYLEFKRVEGSYIVTPATAAATAGAKQAAAMASTVQGLACALRPVPACKSDIFKDRSLTLSEKRSLMGFLAGAVESMQGTGRLKEALAGSTPLAEVLAAEGVPPHLRDVILHGIAMCDWAQETQQPTNQQQYSDGNCTATQQHHEAAAWQMPAKEGAAALQLQMESMARFGGSGSFMVPSWGCGSLPEAFVRCCAVNGGSTVLRCHVSGALLRSAESANGATTQTDIAASPSNGTTTPTDTAVPASHGNAVASDKPVVGVQQCRVEGVVTHRGQVLRCSHLVAGPAIMGALAEAASGGVVDATAASAKRSSSRSSSTAAAEQPTPGPSSAAAAAAAGTSAGSYLAAANVQAPQPADGCSAAAPLATPSLREPGASCVCRALLVLDKPLVSGQSALTLFFQPRSPVLGGANMHAIRGLQLGASLSVCPPSRYLLYLSTPCCPSERDSADAQQLGISSELNNSNTAACSTGLASARQALQLAVQALIQTSDLQPVTNEVRSLATGTAGQLLQAESAGLRSSPSAPACRDRTAAATDTSAAGGTEEQPLQADSGRADSSHSEAACSDRAPAAAGMLDAAGAAEQPLQKHAGGFHSEAACSEAAVAAKQLFQVDSEGSRACPHPGPPGSDMVAAAVVADTPDARPRALCVFYYAQALPLPPIQSMLPGNAVCSSSSNSVDVPSGSTSSGMPPAGSSSSSRSMGVPPGSSSGMPPGGSSRSSIAAGTGSSMLSLVGHVQATAAAEAAFRLCFPGLPWLSELDLEDGGVEGLEEEEDAVEDLQAALGQLAPAQ